MQTQYLIQTLNFPIERVKYQKSQEIRENVIFAIQNWHLIFMCEHPLFKDLHDMCDDIQLILKLTNLYITKAADMETFRIISDWLGKVLNKYRGI